ncbi:MAG: enoyl-CoA hydratase/isomerase family protein [Acidimicrobiales bacterium]
MADNDTTRFGDIAVELDDQHVATVEIQRPPNNFFSLKMLHDLAAAVRSCEDTGARAIVLAAEGKNFCAGASFDPEEAKLTSAASTDGEELANRHIYDEAVELFSAQLPIVAAVQGAAIGGGLGLACMADFRVGGPATRLSANFARLGFHQGFGLSVTLPALVGQQRALELLYTGARIDGEEGHRIGLLDRFVADADIRSTAHELAVEIARSAPLAVASIKQTMRGHLPAAIREATNRERAEQERLTATSDWQEGVKAMAERRLPDFTGT